MGPPKPTIFVDLSLVMPIYNHGFPKLPTKNAMKNMVMLGCPGKIMNGL